MMEEKATESGRVHIHRIDGDTDGIDADPLAFADGPEEPRYAVVLHDHTAPGSGEATAFYADTLNVNSATFAADYAEFGAGGHKRVYRDPNIEGLVRVIISPTRTTA